MKVKIVSLHVVFCQVCIHTVQSAVERVTYRGCKQCYKVRDAQTEVIVGTEMGK